MNRHLGAVLLLAFWFLPTAAARGSEWQIDDDHSNAYFSVQHLTVSKVRGSFNTVRGSVTIDDRSGQLTGLDLTVVVDSIDTGVAKRDEDLRSPNFFASAKYPTITFIAKEIEDLGNGILLLTGNLTIHGITREITATAYGPSPEIKDPWGNYRRGLRLGTRLNRQNYGMIHNKVMDTGGLLIGNMVDAEAELEIVRK